MQAIAPLKVGHALACPGPLSPAKLNSQHAASRSCGARAGESPAPPSCALVARTGPWGTSSRSRLRWLFLLLCAPALWATDSATCADCHRAIYESYRRTPMAMTSGQADRAQPPESFDRAAFAHDGFRYRVTRDYSVEFAKSTGGDLHGRKPLAYFVGSGTTARSYLLDADGFLYEAPVAYYSADAKWDLAPGYDTYAYPFLTRPVLPACLNCHASFLDVAPLAQNRFGRPPFREGGVACERCHGPGEAHVQNGAAILNPAKLAPDRRDSICAQCHLSGEVRVMRAGATWQTYRPGDRLSDSVTVFVPEGSTPGMRVTSHFEKLAQSACKRASGDRLWCGTCHDPHSVPAPAERAAWFRAKCLACHSAGAACKESPSARAARHDDCTACHMPKNPVADAQHVVYTDHSIPRRPRLTAAAAPEAALVRFDGAPASPRDLALAYAIRAVRLHTPSSQARALQRLEEIAPAAHDDAEVLLYLAEIYRNTNRADRAIPLYRRAMQLDPAQVTASVGLGGILFEHGQDREAIQLWQDALAKNSGLVLVGTNLALAQWRSGNLPAAEATLRKLIDLSPAFQPPRDLLKRLVAPPN